MAEASAPANAASQSSLNDQLHDAAAIGDVAALREALAAGADVDARRTDSVTRTPLARVVDPRITISEKRRTACVRALLLAGASPSAPITGRSGGHWVPLHDAAFLGLYTVCRLLLDAGADVNVLSNLGVNDSPLHYAVALNRNQKVVALLLSRGAVDGPRVGSSSYLQKIRAAGGFPAYAKQHRAKLVAMLAPKLGHLLPPELVSVVITFWAPVGLH
jgi:ankyrin repeat protein